MTEENALLIRVDIKQKEDWYFATSKDLPGFLLVDQDKNELIDDLPEAIRILVNARYDVNCKVVPSQFGQSKSKAKRPWLVVPAEIENVALPVGV